MGLSYSDTGPWWWEAAETPPVGWRPFRSTRTTIRQTRRYRVKKREGKKQDEEEIKVRSSFSHIYIYIYMYGGGKNSIDRWDIRRAIRVPRSVGDLAAFVECLASAKRERERVFSPPRSEK